MGKIITIVGNSGVGKTTLAHALCQAGSFASGTEQHIERPFQALTAADPTRYAFTNQVDYLLLRAEQERALREGPSYGVIDGGLDLDYHGFSRLFHHRGYLNDAEYALCGRLYNSLRDLLGPIDLILHLTAPLSVVATRYAQRGRPLEIAQRDDLIMMEQYIADWMAGETSTPVIAIDATADAFCDPAHIAMLLAEIDASLA